jgi:hypothetical protein
VEKHPLVRDATPYGVGVLSNGYRFAWFPHLAMQIINTTFAVVSTTLKKLVCGVCSHQEDDDTLASLQPDNRVTHTNTAGDCSQRAGIHALNLTGIRRM